MSDASAVVAPQVAAGMSCRLRGNAAACDRLGAAKARTVVDEHGVYHVLNVHQ